MEPKTMKVYWLEQTENDLPKEPPPASDTGMLPVPEHGHGTSARGRAANPELSWLSARERDQLNTMHFAKRRADWLLGRWTAKLAVAACFSLPTDLRSLTAIELRPAPSGAPEVFLGNRWTPIAISLSHRAGRAICAVSAAPGDLGCDLEVVEPHSDAFIADYFAPEERALVARASAADRLWLVTLLWSAKESALKALRAGLRLDTQSVIVTPFDRLWNPTEIGTRSDHAAQRADGQRWQALRVCHLPNQTFLGWWQQSGDLLRTVVAAPPPARPLLLKIPRSARVVTAAVDRPEPSQAA
jgi:4'-phosphopantetheinyl transferase